MRLHGGSRGLWPGNLVSQNGCGRFPEGFSKNEGKNCLLTG